jgi:Nitroreductase family
VAQTAGGARLCRSIPQRQSVICPEGWSPAPIHFATPIRHQVAPNAREHVDRPVPEEHLDRVLAAARRSPSASNWQPWDFLGLAAGLSLGLWDDPELSPKVDLVIVDAVLGNLRRCSGMGRSSLVQESLSKILGTPRQDACRFWSNQMPLS